MISRQSQKKIYRGELILELLKQNKHETIPWAEQVVLFYLVEEGYFDDLKHDEWSDFERHLRELMRSRYSDVLSSIHSKDFNDELKKRIVDIATDVKQEFLTSERGGETV